MTYEVDGRRYIGTLSDQPADLVRLRLGRPCDRCKAVCYTARARQRSKGQHPLCGPDAYTDVLTPDAERAALALLLATFPGTTILSRKAPPR